jgi:hypothetical protein
VTVTPDKKDFVVLKQVPTGPCADSWDAVYVNVTANSPEDAIDEVAKLELVGGEGRYVAIPNEWWVAQNVTVKRIAEVGMEREELV